MNKQLASEKDEASVQALRAARRKNASASFAARYQELDRLTGMDAAERAKQLADVSDKK